MSAKSLDAALPPMCQTNNNKEQQIVCCCSFVASKSTTKIHIINVQTVASAFAEATANLKKKNQFQIQYIYYNRTTLPAMCPTNKNKKTENCLLSLFCSQQIDHKNPHYKCSKKVALAFAAQHKILQKNHKITALLCMSQELSFHVRIALISLLAGEDHSKKTSLVSEEDHLYLPPQRTHQ